MTDFGIEKKCGGFEALLGWSYKHEVPRELEDLMAMPASEKVETLFLAPLELYMALEMGFLEGVVVDREVPERKNWYSSW
jgi:hypothetical protein